MKNIMQQHCYDLSKSINIIEYKKIALRTKNGTEYVNCKLIVRIEADNSYSDVFIKDRDKVLVTKAIKKFENELPGCAFFRANKSHLINLHHIKAYNNKNRILTMSDDSKIYLSKDKKKEYQANMNRLLAT